MILPGLAAADESSTHVGVSIIETLQIRIPRVGGIVPDASFSNVLSLAFVLQLPYLELSPRIGLIYSVTSVEAHSGSGMSQHSSASGLGVEAGVRIAVFPYYNPENASGFYFFTVPAYSYWTLNGQFSESATDRFDATITEFGADFGLGGKIPATKNVRIDLYVTALHVGFRPQANEIVSVTSYPGLSFAAELLW